MKFTAATIVLAIAAAPMASAWTFVDGAKHVYDGSANKGCTASSTKTGQTFDWDRGFFENCCIRLYSGTNCATQIGLSCPDWKKASSQNVAAFKVTNC